MASRSLGYIVVTLLSLELSATHLQGGPKKLAHFVVLYASTSSNSDQFSKLFQCQNQENICNNTALKIPPHHKCISTLPFEMSVS